MNSYKYKIHYKQNNINNIGGAVQTMQVQYVNPVTQQQVLLAQQAAAQQLALQQSAAQQVANQQNTINNNIPLQVHTINELFKRVEVNNDLAIYMLDYIRDERPFFDNNEMLTVNNNIFAKKIIDQALISAKNYSKEDKMITRMLQFLKYFDKDNKDLPKSIYTTFVKMLSEKKYLLKFLYIIENIIIIKRKINCPFTSKKLLCGHTPTQIECIKMIVKIIKDIDNIKLKKEILLSTYKRGTETILHVMASQEVDIDILIQLIDIFIDIEKKNKKFNSNKKEALGFTKATNDLINYRYSYSPKDHILLKTDDGNIHYGYSIRFLIKINDKYNKEQNNIIIDLNTLQKLIYLSFKNGYKLKITPDEIIKLYDIYIKMNGQIEYINSYIDDDLFLVKNWQRNNAKIIKYGMQIFIAFIEFINKNIDLTIFKSLILKDKTEIIRKFYIEALNLGIDKSLIDKIVSFDTSLKNDFGITTDINNTENKVNENNQISQNIKNDYDIKNNQNKEIFDKEIKNILDNESRKRVQDLDNFNKLVNEIKESYRQ